MRRFFAVFAALCCLMGALALAEGFPPSSTPTIPGVDVSSWQRQIDWTQVRASGVEIAMIRASEGDNFTDPHFAQNAAGARAAGVAAGYYHFLTAQTTEDAVRQADFFLSVIAGHTPQCRLAVDFGGGATLSDQQLTACALAFLQRVEQQSGYGVMLYTDAWAAKARYQSAIAVYPIWVANYGVTEPEANGKWSSWVGFQYSDRGDVPGISGHVDLDQFTREVYLGPTPTPTPAPTPVPGAETLYYLSVQAVPVSTLAARLNTTVAQLRALNEIVGGVVQDGQVVRYPSVQPSSMGAFAGLHVLQPRENLSTVARRYGTSATTLRALNALPAGDVPKGQVLRIPMVPGRTGVPTPPSWLLENVVVLLQGQTVPDIAALYGIPVSTLYTVNGLTAADEVYRGQILHLQAYGRDEVTGFTGGYVVHSGDTLDRIAHRFGTTVSALYAINNIRYRNLLYPGQVLVLPAR